MQQIAPARRAPGGAGDRDRRSTRRAPCCWRIVDGKVTVLLIHRTRYGDVTLPKGKVDPGETLAETAVREIAEETGLRVALGVPLGVSRYLLPNGREKIVHYWAAEVTDAAIRSVRRSCRTREIAALEWVTLKKAPRQLSYPPDVEILDNFAEARRQGVHAHVPASSRCATRKAVARGELDGPDAARPLHRAGHEAGDGDRRTAARAWAPQRIVSSPAVRCVNTVAPLAAATGIKIKRDRRHQPGRVGGRRGRGARASSASACASGKTAVLCSHGPVLPEIMREIALATGTPLGVVRDAMPRGSSRARSPSCTSRSTTRLGHRRDRDARAPRLAARSPRAVVPHATSGAICARSPSVHHRGGSSLRRAA